MNTLKLMAIHIQAADLRRSVRRMRKSRGLPTDLKQLIEKCRESSPETAELLNQVLFPKLNTHTQR